MRLLRPVVRRLRALLQRERMEADLGDELRFHLEMQTEVNERLGMSAQEARRQAVLAFGTMETHREEMRDARGIRPLEELGRDAKYGVRVLGRSPGFTAVAVLTLGLGIGATTAMFSIVDGVLLRPLVYPEAEQIFQLWEQNDRGALRPASYPGFRDWREEAESFSDLAYIRGDDFILNEESGPQLLLGAYVTDGFFEMMRTAPLLGRTLRAGEAGDERSAVLSHRLWLQGFGGDVGVIGRSVATPDGSFTVVGVMPPGFQAPSWADVWLPIMALPPADRYALEQRNLHVDSQVLGRLAPGVSPERAEAEMRGIAAALAAAHPEDADWARVSLSSIVELTLGDAGGRMLVLGSAVLLVLLVACVNLANLQLARASTRSREMAVRTALGARRGRLVRQLLTENVVLALAGGALGTAGAVLGVRALRAAAHSNWWSSPLLPRLQEVAVDGRVLLFALALSLGTAVLSGLLPALRAASGDLVEPLKSGTAGAGSARGTAHLRSALVVAQIALALVLVVGAGLLIKSLLNLQRVELGFDPEGVVAVRVFPPPRYAEAEAAMELYRRLRESLASVPGVQEAALANFLPLAGGSVGTRIVPQGRPLGEGSEQVIFRTVSPEYFRALGTRVLRGRGIEERDLAGPGGLVLNEAAARRFWPDSDPVGQSVTIFKQAQGRPDLGDPITAVVVGVVADERYFELGSEPPPAVYVPYTWNPWPNIFLTVRAEGNAAALIPALRRAVLSVDPDLPVAGPGYQTQFRPLDEYLAGSLDSQRLNASLLGGFALAAFMLAVIGIFGVMAYVVVRRTREIGLRIALGAPPGDVARRVAGQTLALAAAGVGLGLVGAFAATRLLRGLLYEVSATDPWIFLAVAASFLLAALLAGLLPARRAARVDPMVALRVE